MIYLDYAAATPLDPRVFKAMQPFLTKHFGNASSIHQFGQLSRQAVDESREKCRALLGAFSLHEIIFTGSGTESCNMAIFGAAFAALAKGHIIISAIEHPAVLEPARYLRDNFGFELTEVLPNKEGIVEPQAIRAALRKDTILVSVMLMNNEIGTIQPVKEIAKIVRDHPRPGGAGHRALFHTDACQAPGFTDIRVDNLEPDLLSLNGSKIYGPKGVGLLYIREGVKITPLIQGGGQEFQMRGGTENTANIVGFTKALELILEERKTEEKRIGALRDELLGELLKIKGVTLNGSREHRAQNNINIHVDGVSGETLVIRLDLSGLAASGGSACSSGKTEPSPVLLALGQAKKSAPAKARQAATESLRLTLGRPTTPAEIREATRILKKVLNKS